MAAREAQHTAAPHAQLADFPFLRAWNLSIAADAAFNAARKTAAIIDKKLREYCRSPLLFGGEQGRCVSSFLVKCVNGPFLTFTIPGNNRGCMESR